MKNLISLFVFVLFYSLLNSSGSLLAQDKAAIKQAVLNYAESYYTGNIDKFIESVHPDIKEVSYSRSANSDDLIFNFTSYSALVENIKAADSTEAPMTIIQYLQSDPNYVNIRVSNSDFSRYLQLVKMDKKWKVLNSLNAGDEKDLELDKEKAEIENSVKDYLEGIVGGNAKVLESVIFDDFYLTRISMNNKTGSSFVNRLGKNKLIENSLNKAGVLDEPMRKYEINVLDVMRKTAAVEAVSPARVDYLQMIKTGNGWKVLSSLGRANPDYSFTANSPIYLGKPMPDFTLPLFEGGEFTLSEKQGKKIMLIFLRGWIGNIWCPLCQYQYNELVQLEEKNHWREKYNMEIYFVLPYSKERIEDWFNNFETASKILNNWKNLKGPEDFVTFVNDFYPMEFELENGNTKRTFPVIVDANREVSRRFKLFTTFFDGVKAEQNIPTIYILDEKGNVKFKYFSQQTQDRPTYDYLMNVVENME